MPGGGSTYRRAGRQKGTPNKRTQEALLIAASTIDAAKEGKVELAKDALNRLMVLALGATAIHQPTTDQEIAAGKAKKGSWPLFGQWFDRAAYVAEKLAKYQSPTFKAIMVSAAPENPAPAPPPKNVVQIDDAVAASRVYAQLVKRSAAA